MSSDFLIVGSGIAGLFLAEKLSEIGKVTLVTKGALNEANTNFAQGGIAAVRDFQNDSVEAHIQDTLKAGAFHNDRKAVDFLARNADKAIQELNAMGIIFDSKPTREGGHSFSRIWHKDDFSGEHIEENLILKVQKNARINLWDHAFAFDLLVEDGKCAGVFVEDHNREVHILRSKNIILAMGGAGALFAKTTNPSGAVGDGIALALKHNVKLADLEFIQFHPTVLEIAREPMFLLSEALRGEGAKLVNAVGENFMTKYHAEGDLAPRDIVTRAICQEQKKGQVYLDMRHIAVDFIRARFPNIAHELRKYDLKLERDLIPITPAAHYTCGGIQTDLEGRTSLKNLFAVGEVACTGIHGANRLASNSLLEGVVFAEAIYNSCKRQASSHKLKSQADFGRNGAIKKIRSESSEGFLREVKEIMWECFGIIRETEVMKRGLDKLHKLKPQDVCSENAQLAAVAIAEACLARQASLGCHYVAQNYKY